MEPSKEVRRGVKTRAVIAVLIVVVSLIGVVMMNERKERLLSFLDESELDSPLSVTRPIYQFYKAGSPSEREYSMLSSPVPAGFSSQGVLASLFVLDNGARTPLSLYVNPSTKDSQLRLYRGDSGYEWVYTAGWCSLFQTGDLQPMYEVYRIMSTKRDFAYAIGLSARNTLVAQGYRSGSLVCYVKPGSGDGPIPPFKPPLFTPSDTKPIFEFFKAGSPSLREYDVIEDRVPSGYVSRGVLAEIFHLGGTGRKPIRLWYNQESKDTRLILGTNAGTGYVFELVIGYCADGSQSISGLAPMYELYRILPNNNRDFAYAVGDSERNSLRSQGYRLASQMCYVKPV